MKKKKIIFSWMIILIVLIIDLSLLSAITGYIQPPKIIFERNDTENISIFEGIINLKNKNHYGVMIDIGVNGDIEKITTIDKESFKLLALQSEEITFSIEIPSGKGDYYGTISATYTRINEDGELGQTISVGCELILLDNVKESIKDPESYCGDGICNGFIGETSETCNQDCGDPELFCGDGRCNEDETCSTCKEDCGACPVSSGDSGGSSGGSGGGGSSSGGSSSGGSSSYQSSNEEETIELIVKTEEDNQEEKSSEEIIEEKNFRGRITGAVIGFAKSKQGVGFIFTGVVIISGIAVISILNYRKKKRMEEI